MTLTINEIADVINISVSNPSESGYDVFVGLEHYDIGEPVITRYGSTKMLTTACKKFSAGDILLARRNVYLRRAGVVEFDGLTSGDSIVIRVKPNLSIEGVDSNAISRLLPFILNTNAFWDFANTNSDGTMSKRLSPQMLLSYEFELPPVADQKPLADKLWAAYKLKASKLKLIDAIDEMVKSQFIEMFGAPANNERGLAIKHLNEISDNLDSKRIPITSGDRKEGPYPYYGASGIVDHVAEYIFDETLLLISEDGANLKDRVTPIAFTASGRYWVNNHAHILRFKDISLHNYVEYFINYLNVEKYLTGMAQPKLNQDRLNAIPVNMPSSTDLVKFHGICNQADKSKSVCRLSIKRLAS